MAQKRKNGTLWEDEFQDLSSFSQPASTRRPGTVSERPPSRRISPERRPSPPRDSRPGTGRTSSRPASSGKRRPAGRQEPEWEIPEWEVSGGRNKRQQDERVPRKPPPKKPISRPGKVKRTMGKAVRRTLAFLTILIMVAVTAVLAVFLLFKVSHIQVTGDFIEGYDNETIIDISGCEVGDNLFFLTTSDKEARICEQLPYVGKAKIRRHLPGTLEIQITATHAAACVFSGGNWLYIDGSGKILELRDQPQNGLLQIQGVSSTNTLPGQLLTPEDPDFLYACNTIITALRDREMLGDFTSLNLTNLFDIRLIYQNRIEFLLGGVSDLSYKVDFGCRSLSEQSDTARGVFDLINAGKTKRATFTEGEIGAPIAAVTTPNPESSEPGAQSDSSGMVDNPSDSEAPLDNSYRDEGIPDHPFTGDSG